MKFMIPKLDKISPFTWRLFTAAEMAALIYLSVRPEHERQGTEQVVWELFHKFGHVVAYAALMFLWLGSLTYFYRPDAHRGRSEERDRRILWTAFLITVSFGALNEFFQMFFPTRFPGVKDIVINAVGALIVVVTAKHYRSRMREA